MCDTSVAVGNATADHTVIFAKNSDRAANECQPLDYVQRQEHPAGSRVRCTYRDLPQARETFAVLGSRPYWMWGFEMGVNEHGVSIGNEAVYGREGYLEDGLLGMDLLRLGLERGRTADEAFRIIVELLEAFGQGGSADVAEKRFYHNSFIIADPQGAWVLETAGKYWAAERVRERRAISNCYTITTEWDEASPGLIDHAVAQGWWNPRDEFNFALAYGDPSRDTRSGQCRFQRATTALREKRGLVVADLLDVLRDHTGVASGPNGESIPFPICMHETPPRVGATAASLVVHLRARERSPLSAVVWHGFGSPCRSAVVPIYVQAGASPAILSVGGSRFDPSSPWWLVERIQRRADAYPDVQRLVQTTLREVERCAVAAAAEVEGAAKRISASEAAGSLRKTSDELVARAVDTLRELDQETARLCRSLPQPRPPDLEHWRRLNEPVGIDLFADGVAQSGNA